MNFRNVVRNVIPASYRRRIKDRLGMPRWLHDNYAFLRCIGPFDEAHVVLDIGACNGWFTECWLEYSPRAAVHCFEPSTMTFNKSLKARLGDRPGITMNNVGVGSEVAAMVLHTGASYASSSFYELKPSNELNLDLSKSEEVPVIRMDDYLGKHGIDDVKLVKIDVQGHELPVLQGFGEYLEKVDYFYIEVSIHSLYEQEATLCPVLEYLERKGYLVTGIKPNSLDGKYIQEADLLFARKDLVL